MDIPTTEDFARLEQKVSDLQALIVNLVNHNDFRRVVTVSDICTIEGLSKPQVLGKERYLLPNFGVSQYPEGTVRWDIETFLDWRRIPVEQRQRMYLRWLDNKRLQAVERMEKEKASAAIV